MPETPTPARAAEARRPDWPSIYGYPIATERPNALLTITRHSAALALSALEQRIGDDAYSTDIAAAQEIETALGEGVTPTTARAADAREITDELVERGARAICEEWGYLWEDGDPTSTDPRAIPEDVTDPADDRPDKRLCRRVARACLTAALPTPPAPEAGR